MNVVLRGGRSVAPTTHVLDRDQAIPLAYVAQWHEYEILDEDGLIDATISATSYVIDEQNRPVTFLWNGGPGASSSPLHMNALGPRVLVDGAVLSNADTILDATDLVFIDPVGTGFSRLQGKGAESRHLTVGSDAANVEALIRQWLSDNNRLASAVHLVGESYGGYRLAALAPLVIDLPIESITLISPALDTASTTAIAGNILPGVMELPTMAVTAWKHGKSTVFDQADHIVSEVWDAADEFAVTELLPALYRGSALAAEERARLISRISALTGMPEVLVDAHNLAIDSETFLQTLRHDDDLLVGRLDTRVTGPVPPPRTDGMPGAVDDPTLGMGSTFVIVSAPIGAYLRDEIGVPGDDDYTSLSLKLNFAWDWRQEKPWPAEPYQTGVPALRVLLDARPDTRVLLIGGFYDLATTLASTVRAVRHAIDDPARLEVARLDGGHSIDESVRAVAAQALRRTISPGGFT